MNQVVVSAALFMLLIAASVAYIPTRVYSQLPFAPSSPSSESTDNATSSAVSAVISSNQSSKTTQQQGLLTYTDPEGRFTINYPSNWKIKPTDGSSALLSIDRNKIVEFDLNSDRPTMSGNPATDASLAISIENTSKYLDTNTLQVKTHPLRDYVNGKISTINSLAFGSDSITLKYLKDASTKVAGLPAWIIAYTSAFAGIPSLYETTTYMIDDNKLYTFDYHSAQLKVPETLPVVQKMINSFKLTK
jgi:hypothetical protein